MIKIELNLENKQKIFPLTKDYLSDKKFHYNTYIKILYNCWWKKININETIRYEYNLNYLNILYLSKTLSLNRSNISNHLKYPMYRIKNDDYGNKHLYINSPTKNYTMINLCAIDKLIDIDNELATKLYIYIYGKPHDVVYGLNHNAILNDLGMNNKSNSNKQKLADAIKILIDNKLLERDVKSNGTIKYCIYKKVNKNN